MFYILYEIRNNLNGKIYVGVHKTKSLDDGYMGSGKVINAAIAKYGIENFTKRILEQFDDSAAMFAREKEIVTDEFLLREDVYNLRRGGFGGFEYINKNALNGHGLASMPRDKLLSFVKELGRIQGNKNKIKWEKDKSSRPFIFTPEFNAEMNKRAQSVAAQEKKKKTYKEIGHQQGEKNSSFGSMWITNETRNKKIKKIDPIPEGWRKGRI